MATQTLVSAPAASLLRRTLQGNSLFSATSAVIFILAANPIAAFMGVATPVPFIALGVGLLAFAGAVYFVSSRTSLDTGHTRIIFGLDVLWILGSVLILATDAFSLSTGGRWLVLILADIVLVIAILEFVGLRRLR